MALVLRRGVVAIALAMATIVVAHAVTCGVAHAASIADASEHLADDHFPEAVLAAVAALLVLAALGLRTLDPRRRLAEPGAGTRGGGASSPGRSPPGRPPAAVPSAASLCVFRC